MSETPRTDDLAASIDPWTMVDEAFAEIKSHAEKMEIELIEMGMERTRLITAVNDAIRRPLGVVPASAEEFYRP